jgi:P-type Cu+ transporter
VALAQLRVGDRLLLRHGELVPADARLITGDARIDYSFVTGESSPVSVTPGESMHAGGRQTGGLMELETIRPVSQSHLASLWNQDAFRKDKDDIFATLTNLYSRRFTGIILGISLACAGFWLWRHDAPVALKAFTSVLIVACPCALALAAPFTLGTALRVLARHKIFLRNADVVEALARIDTVIFDKTGTLTSPSAGPVTFIGKPLLSSETDAVAALLAPSNHPLARRVAQALPPALESVLNFEERPGHGITGSHGGTRFTVGSVAWMQAQGVAVPELPDVAGSRLHLAIANRWRGCFEIAADLRPELGRLIQGLASLRLGITSGDNNREQARFEHLLGPNALLRFQQSPQDKLAFIRELQSAGGRVMMVGDGLNDAGALRQSDVGVAVVEEIGTFSPASDVIIEAAHVTHLANVLSFARSAVRVVRASFLISTLYNVIGIAIAATGRLEPIVCAVLMPLSSVTVVLFACAATRHLGRRSGFPAPRAPASATSNPPLKEAFA